MSKPGAASPSRNSAETAKPTRTKKATAKTDKPEKTAKPTPTKAETTKTDRPTRTREAIAQAKGPARSYIYTETIADEICKRLAASEPLRQICKLEGMPDQATVLAWSLDHTHPFAQRYARAREIGYRALADEILEISDDANRDLIERADGVLTVDHEHIQRARLRVDTRKWLLAKMLPKVYGDKFQVGGDGGEPLTFKLIPGDEKL